MSRNYKFRDQDKLYFVSFTTVYWIDVFTRNIYKDMVVDSLKYCIAYKGLELYAWCDEQPCASHQDILRDMKRHTAKAILKAIAENIQESRREWMLYMFERAGKRNANNER